jgi:hypothetical protein
MCRVDGRSVIVYRFLYNVWLQWMITLVDIGVALISGNLTLLQQSLLKRSGLLKELWTRSVARS